MLKLSMLVLSLILRNKAISGLTAALLCALTYAGVQTARLMASDAKVESLVTQIQAERLKLKESEAERAKAVAEQTVIEVVRYVDRVKEIPGPTVIRDRIVRLCDQDRNSEGDGVSGSPRIIDPGTDPDHRSIDGLAEDLAAVQRNHARCEAIIGIVRQQLPSTSKE